MKLTLKKALALTVFLGGMSAAVEAIPDVKNESGKEIKCRLEVFRSTDDYVRCGGLVNIAKGAQHVFETGGNTGFDEGKCAANPKPKGAIGGYTAWILKCDNDDVGLSVEGEMRPNDLNVARPIIVREEDGELTFANE